MKIFIYKNLPIIFGIIITIIILNPLLINNLLYTDDSELHAARFANYYLALKQQQFPPRWAPNLNSGYGYPVLQFSYPLPYIAGGIIKLILPLSLQQSVNISAILFLVSSFVGSYFWIKKKNSVLNTLILASIFTFSPYPLINIFSRFAYGEIAFWGVLPWVFYSIDLLYSKKYKYSKLIYIFVFSALLLSHQSSIVIIIPLLLGYLLINKYNLKNIILPSLISVFLVCWYWIPALLELKYVKLVGENIITNYLSQFPNSLHFFLHKINNLNRLDTLKMVSIGYSAVASFILSIYLIFKKRLFNQFKKYHSLFFWFVILIFSIILMMPFTKPLWIISPLSKYIQYSWRLLWITTLSTVGLTNELFKLIKNQNLMYIFQIILITSVLISINTFAVPRGYINLSDYELREYFNTTTTFNEFLPIWADEFVENYPTQKISLRKKDQKYFIENIPSKAEGEVSIISWNGTKMAYSINAKENIDVIQATHYFPGWELRINGLKKDIEYQDNEFPGFIKYSLEEGKYLIEAEFTNNSFAKNLGTILSIFGVIALITWTKIKKNN